MGAVAERWIFRMLTVAEGYSFLLLQGQLGRSKTCSFVASVTERLSLREPASTPPIVAGFELQDFRRFLKDLGFFHTGESLGDCSLFQGKHLFLLKETFTDLSDEIQMGQGGQMLPHVGPAFADAEHLILAAPDPPP